MKTLIYISVEYTGGIEVVERYGLKKLADEIREDENIGENEGYVNTEIYDEVFDDTYEVFVSAKRFKEVNADVVDFLSGFMEETESVYLLDEKGNLL